MIPKIHDEDLRILVAPLNWGLGHAARCIPIIHELLEQGHEVIIAADGYPLELLQQEFPYLTTILLESAPIKYSYKNTQVGAMVRAIPSLIKGIFMEHEELKDIINEYGVNLVISDNRFGLWSKNIPCVYISHQLMIKMPHLLKRFEPIIWRIHRFIIHRYNECWIPDEAENGLSGDLAHKYPLPKNAKFIGILSRFSYVEAAKVDITYDVLCVLSGPEPQRGIWENELTELYHNENQKVLIVRGMPQHPQDVDQLDNITYVSHLPTPELKAHLLSAKEIICRSGYSSLMDLKVLGRTASLVPTPGQTEQEYLAELHFNNKF